MKYLSIITSALAALSLAACTTEDELLNSEQQGEKTVNITLSAPEALETRAAATNSSALGGITNVDMTKYDVRYQLVFYDKAGQVVRVARMTKTVDEYQPVTFQVTITPGVTYHVVAWGDFVAQGTDTDLHYDTSDLTNITCNDTNDKQINDESRDAYFYSQDITCDANNLNQNIVLKRPFSKVRVVTTDWNYENLPMPDNFKITYKNCTRFSGMNAVTGIATGAAADGTTEYVGNILTDKANKFYAGDYDSRDTCRTLTVDYLMVNSDENKIHFELEALNGTESLLATDIKTDIPTKRNYLTTIVGNFLTADCKFTVSINEWFSYEWVINDVWWTNPDLPDGNNPKAPQKSNDGWFEVHNADEFTYFCNTINDGDKIRLMADIDLNAVDNFKPIGHGNLKNVQIDGQDHTISNVKIDTDTDNGEGYGVFGILYEGSVIKNVNFKNITINGRSGSEGHESERIKSAGCVGFLRGSIENCHAEHIYINGRSEKGLIDDNCQNLGGLVGYFNNPGNNTIKNCSAKDVLIYSNRQAGGLVGSIGDEHCSGMSKLFGTCDGTITTLIENCKTDGVAIHNTGSNVKANAYLFGTITGGLGQMIGDINHGKGLTMRNCKTTKTFEVFGKDGNGDEINTYYMDELAKGRTYQQQFFIGLVRMSPGADAVVMENCEQVDAW